jgi:hypothetical protein
MSSATASARERTALFQKSTRKNQEFERYLCDGQEAAILDATTSKYIPLSYFVTPHTASATTAASAPPRRSSSRNAHGIADKMPYESFRLINVQQRGNHAHSLVLFKSRAITTNPEQIAIFECNGKYTQSEIRVIHTSYPSKEEEEDSNEPGTVYDVSEYYFSPVSPKICLNYGNDTYNPGYCGMFGIIAMAFHRHWRKKAPESWIKEWTQLLKYMRQDIPDEPESHGCQGISLAAKVQEIIAAHPSTQTAHQNAEKEIIREIKNALKTMKHKS